MSAAGRPVGDTAGRHHSVRKGRERGCWVYIPQAVLDACGVEPAAPPPDYRVYTTSKRRRRAVLVQLYERAEPLDVALHRRAVEAS